jgi:chromatin remodeling complex protein RSC6
MAKKTTAKKATAKKAPAKKAAAPKKATVKKAAAPKKATAKKAAAPKKATAKKAAAPKKAKTARKPNAAFMKALKPSSALAEIIGAAEVARTEAVKKIWGYIKKHNLQNPKNKRNILADDKLSKIFGKKEVTMFELAKILGKHLS